MVGGVPAVKASVAIIEALAKEWPQGVQTSTLVAELRLNRSTCYNILSTLQQAGWVTNLGSRAGWTLSLQMFTFAAMGPAENLRLMQAEIDELARDLGFVVFISQRLPTGEYAVIAKAERQFGVRVIAAVGDRFPFSAPALLHAFDAWTEPDWLMQLIARHGLQSFTEYTITEPAALHEELAQVRERGFSSSIRQYDLAQGGVAAPIFDSHGRTIMAVCTLAFSTDLNHENVDTVGARVRDCAGRITGLLGGEFPSQPGAPAASSRARVARQ